MIIVSDSLTCACTQFKFCIGLVQLAQLTELIIKVDMITSD